ncbi:MAG: hypothetical protein Q8P24_02110 [Desulfobacterales bacterium]|nr:hypothetical protein [Desulfobacterales bacterium]
MLTVKVEGIKEVKKLLSELEKNQFPFAYAKSLTLVAKTVRSGEYEEMKRVFDRPTPYTLNSLFVDPATKTMPASRVWLKWGTLQRTQHHLEPQIFGGGRHHKNFEKALYKVGALPRDMYIVPARKLKLDWYGNIPASTIIKMLSWFRAFSEVGYLANRAAKVKQKKGYSYFAVKSGGGKLRPGIWARSKKGVEPVFMFVRAPKYKKRFDFFGEGGKIFKREWRPIFNKAMTDALATADAYAKAHK